MGRLFVALAIAFPVSVVVAAAASGAATSGSGPAVLKCMHWQDGMNISPGVGNAPSGQTVNAHGKLFGCNKAGGGAQYSATLQMSQATCSNLAMSGTASFDWANGNHSTAFLQFHPQALEPNKVFVNGSMTSGLFQGLVVSAWLRFSQVYSGSGANCSPSNLLRHIDFTNSQSFQLLTPNVTTTTQAIATTSQPNATTTPTTSPNSFPTTVPVTNLGSTVPVTSPVRVTTVIFQRGGGGGGGGGGGVQVVSQPFPSGTLAFTGSSSGLAASFGFEVLLVGGALAFADKERKRRRFARFARARRPKSFLQVTLPPMH